MSALISVLLVLLSLFLENRAVTIGLAVGALIGLVFFAVAWWAGTAVVRVEGKKPATPAAKVVAVAVFIVKFPLAGLFLWYMFKHYAVNPFALIGGVAVTQAAILIAGLSKTFKRADQK